jgi:hypothetical protein
MSEFFFLRFEIVLGRFTRVDLERNAFDDLKSRFLQRLDLLWIVRHYPNFSDPEIRENLGALMVAPCVDREPELFIRFDRVGTLVLQRVSPNLVDDPDPAS